jgi:uncharacterized protein
MPQLSAEAHDLTWLIGSFAKQTPGVAHAMVISADGLPVAVSDRLDRAKADQLAAIASGLDGLTQGAARLLDRGTRQADDGRDGPRLTDRHGDRRRLLPCVLAVSPCDVGVVAYQMAVLVTRVGEVLTPTLRAELQAALPA